jgi:myo-inositol catabolism protein IolC
VTVSGLGHSGRLHILACDHRQSLERSMFGIDGVPSQAERGRIVDLKRVVFEGLELALQGGVDRASAGMLVDEQYGAAVARTALDQGLVVAMPVERSGQREFQLEYGDDFEDHLRSFEPTFVKALVRWNPDGDAAMNGRQGDRLARLSDRLHDTGRKLLFELLVPAEPHQLARVAESQDRYDAELRPALMVGAIAQIQAAGVEADVWKIEGLDDSADCARVAAQARAGGRDQVGCVVLGRGADASRVDAWLAAGAAVPGFIGFAVGRSLWWDAAEGFVRGELAREVAAKLIAASYTRLVQAYETLAEPKCAFTRGHLPGYEIN